MDFSFLILPLIQALAWMHYYSPPSMKRRYARGLAWVMDHWGLRKKVIRQNLEIAYSCQAVGARDFDQIHPTQRMRNFYIHLAWIVFEILYLFGPMKKFVMTRSQLKGLEHWQKALERGKGVLFLANHIGNWEVMAATGALQGRLEVLLVTKHLKPEWLHRAIEAGRKSCGVKGTYEPRTMKEILAALKRNQTVGIVLDQYAGPPIGVRVPFFGKWVGTSSVVAILAKRTGAVVLPVNNRRLSDGSFEVEIEPPMEWEATSPVEGGNDADTVAWEIAWNTQKYTHWIEKSILANPDQWLWIHRRFKGELGPLRDREWLEKRPRTGVS